MIEVLVLLKMLKSIQLIHLTKSFHLLTAADFMVSVTMPSFGRVKLI